MPALRDAGLVSKKVDFGVKLLADVRAPTCAAPVLRFLAATCRAVLWGPGRGSGDPASCAAPALQTPAASDAVLSCRHVRAWRWCSCFSERAVLKCFRLVIAPPGRRFRDARVGISLLRACSAWILEGLFRAGAKVGLSLASQRTLRTSLYKETGQA